MTKYQINIILVNPIYATNIGASARALANMGGGRLLLLDPKTSINSKARQGAAGAQDQLGQRIIYKSWGELLNNENSGVYIALSKRRGKSRISNPLKNQLTNLKETLITKEQSEIFFVFGPEDNGLSSEDISHCNVTCSLPEYGDFNSYNLAQAVLLTLFIANQEFSIPSQINSNDKKASHFPDSSLSEWLTGMGYDLTAPRVNIFNTLKGMILRSIPTDKEISNLESALQQSIRKNKD